MSALASENTRFLLIGAHALAYHVEARLTEDLDVFVEPSLDNAARLHRALVRFGFGDLLPSQQELATPDRVFMLGRKPWRIDILTGIDGVSFERAWATRERVDFYGMELKGRSYFWGDVKAFPASAREAIENMVLDKLLDAGLLDPDPAPMYEAFMKLAGPYWMSVVAGDADLPILEPDHYLSYQHEA